MVQSLTKQKLTDPLIKKLILEYKADEIKEIRELSDGYFNAAYYVEFTTDEKIVLKIAPPKNIQVMQHEENIIETEVKALKIVSQKTSLPVPNILLYVKDSPYVDSPYFIMEYIEGIALDKIMHDLNPKELNHIYKQLGHYTKELHQIKGSQFGYVLNGKPGFDTWSEAFISIIDVIFDDAYNKNIILPLYQEEIRKLVLSFSSILDSVKTPTLLHKDLWMGNLFINSNTLDIVSIIDWERALYGDILLEFIFAYLEGPEAIKGVTDFNIAYGRSEVLSYDEIIRSNLYYLYYLLLIYIESYYRGYHSDENDMKLSKRIVQVFEALKEDTRN